ncbi:hypothetical protein QE152_g27491 [Popillia japonica]|uniref:Uncharacterized protein n=1 Tax=Popillia japonica TaxID=7064 RepID=A0AAW1JUI2_POPJA
MGFTRAEKSEIIELIKETFSTMSAGMVESISKKAEKSEIIELIKETFSTMSAGMVESISKKVSENLESKINTLCANYESKISTLEYTLC